MSVWMSVVEEECQRKVPGTIGWRSREACQVPWREAWCGAGFKLGGVMRVMPMWTMRVVRLLPSPR